MPPGNVYQTTSLNIIFFHKRSHKVVVLERFDKIDRSSVLERSVVNNATTQISSLVAVAIDGSRTKLIFPLSDPL